MMIPISVYPLEDSHLKIFKTRVFFRIFFYTLIFSFFFSHLVYSKNKDSFSDIFLTQNRIEMLKMRIQNKTSPTYNAWVELEKQCELALSQKPKPVSVWAVQGYYDDPKGHLKATDILQKDAVASYRLAVCYRITNQSEFADQALVFLKAWMITLKSGDLKKVDTKLTMSRLFPMMIVASHLLKSYHKTEANFEVKFKYFLENIVLPLNSMTDKNNNHANWGMLLVLASSIYLEDESLFNKVELRFKNLIDIQMTEDGILRLEIERSDTKDFIGGPTKGINGIWYTNYALMPTVLSAEILLVNGRNLYNYESSIGGSLRKAFKLVSKWSVYPETFPYYKSNKGKLNGLDYVSYFELLNPMWPYSLASKKLDRLRPMDVEISFPNLTFTHGDLGPDLTNR